MIDIERVALPAEAFNPRVLFCDLYTHEFSYPKGYRYPERYVYDYELELIIHSEGAMYIDDRLYPVEKGDVVFRRPGQLTQGIPPYNCYLICIDLAGNVKDAGTYAFCPAIPDVFQPYYINPLLEAIPVVCRPYPYEKYQHLFDRVYEEFSAASDTSPMMLKSYALRLLTVLIQDAGQATNTVIASSPYGKVIKAVLDHIHHHIDARLSLDALAKIADLSPTYFHKVFREAIGTTPNEYITRFRMELAKELLLSTDTPIYKVGQKVGIENAPYFSYLFKKYTGISPDVFRKRHTDMS